MFLDFFLIVSLSSRLLFHASFHEDIPICLILEVLPNIAPLVWPVKLCYLKQNSSALKPLHLVSAL